MATTISKVSRNNANKNIFEHHPKKTIVIFIIILFFFVEISGHFIYYFTHDRTFKFNETDFVRFTPYGLVEYKPNSTIKLPGFPSSLETDQYGFVNNGNNRDIGNEEYLIFVVGGSTVEGRGASSNAATIAAYLEKILNQQKHKTRFRVINAAVCGYMSYQELSFIEGKIRQNFKPQMIIALDGRNDAFYASSFKEWRPNWMPYYDQLTVDVNKNMEPGLAILLDLARRYSILASAFKKIHQKLFDTNKNNFTQETFPSDERIETAVKAYIVNHVVAHERLRQYDIKYYLFLQPTLSGSLKRKISPIEAKYVKEYASQYKNSEIYYYGIDKFYKTVGENAEKLDYFYNISTLFMDIDDTVYVDNCHYSDVGNYMIAQSIAQKILPNLDN